MKYLAQYRYLDGDSRTRYDWIWATSLIEMKEVISKITQIRQNVSFHTIIRIDKSTDVMKDATGEAYEKP